ncbi:uncharacterized protein LOC128877905 [Hylaeus volcanicus]|uniref:uncharacterized protein LOC128877905 n=1 Tax=Hylaeus volcanicus TaxID=313075 RepID=UPI0023B7B485|nr:uncharacterized protein LOC128877905 [Hylaeus volcanicus]
MNSIRTVTLKLLRSYATRYPSETIGIDGKLKLKKMEQSEIDLDEFVEDDLDEGESDFMNVGKSYDMHQREMEKKKEIMKASIVKKKYFKNIQPNFLTFVERDQIQKLHKSDPEEWTPEKLSKSFPALPESIRKILISKFVPKSVEEAIKYDTRVVENWKMFKTGKLVVDPDLNDHLMKFRHRKINLTDRESLVENLIPPKMEFPKPRSVMFSNMIKGFVNVEQSSHNQQQISDRSDGSSDKKELITIEKENIKTPIVQTNKSTNAKNYNQKNNKVKEKFVMDESTKKEINELYETSPEKLISFLKMKQDRMKSSKLEDVSSNILQNTMETASTENKSVIVKPLMQTNEHLNVRNDQICNNTNRKLTFDEFMKKNLNNMNNTSPEEEITLRKTYREHIESINAEDVSSNILNDTMKGLSKEEKNLDLMETSSDKCSLIMKQKEPEFKAVGAATTYDGSIGTYVKERNTSIDKEFKYAMPIKIPKNVYKKGMTYKVVDCYYDDDGEFLYRTPGLRN